MRKDLKDMKRVPPETTYESPKDRGRGRGNRDKGRGRDRDNNRGKDKNTDQAGDQSKGNEEKPKQIEENIE